MQRLFLRQSWADLHAWLHSCSCLPAVPSDPESGGTPSVQPQPSTPKPAHLSCTALCNTGCPQRGDHLGQASTRSQTSEALTFFSSFFYSTLN